MKLIFIILNHQNVRKKKSLAKLLTKLMNGNEIFKETDAGAAVVPRKMEDYMCGHNTGRKGYLIGIWAHFTLHKMLALA